jgi:hypothetical protein
MGKIAKITHYEVNKSDSKEELANILSLDIFDYIKSFVASVDKISSEPAFRDYIINNLLNLYELAKE